MRRDYAVPRKHLPTSKKEMEQLGWQQADIIIFTGDSYVDHPAFGVAIIGRLLEKEGYKVAIIPQPNWRDDLRDFKKLGEPKLFFGVTSGNMDSMVNHYTANKRLRSDDAYTAGGKAGFRPDYATIVYSKILKKLYPNKPLVIGGIEASLRRFTHYDYWCNCLKPSILIESEADMLVYGMGESPILEIASRVSKGYDIKSMKDIPQTAYVNDFEPIVDSTNIITLHSYEDCLQSKLKFGENFKKIEIESNKLECKTIIEPYYSKAIVVNPPYKLPSSNLIDSWYDLPYTRLPHPRYLRKKIPAWEMIKHSITIHRGCFGGCSFCTISAHQGKFIVSRSESSILKEVNEISQMNDFKGHISDLGGPSANMYRMSGIDKKKCEGCTRPSCIFPKICNNLDTSHGNLLRLYRQLRSLTQIKKVNIGSGVRYDLFINSENRDDKEYLSELLKYHVSGRLKVAPEHTNDDVLKMMRKPSFTLFKALNERFKIIDSKYHLNQQLIPYFISSHPGSTIDSMEELSKEVQKLNFELEQVQDFTPTPMTLASTIFYTGIDPYNGKRVYVARDKSEKLKQKEMFFRKPRFSKRKKNI